MCVYLCMNISVPTWMGVYWIKLHSYLHELAQSWCSRYGCVKEPRKTHSCHGQPWLHWSHDRHWQEWVFPESARTPSRMCLNSKHGAGQTNKQESKMCTRFFAKAHEMAKSFWLFLFWFPNTSSHVRRCCMLTAQGGKVGVCTCTRYTSTYTHAQTHLHAWKWTDVRSLIHARNTCIYIHTHRIDTCIHVTCSLHTASILSRMHVHMGAHLYTCLYSCMYTKSCTAYAQCLHVH